MKVLGKRFLTWMGVWALSLFVRGEGIAEHQEQSAPQETSSTAKHHKVPTPHFTRHKVGADVIHEKMSPTLYDKRKDKWSSPPTTLSKTVKSNTVSGSRNDAGSKDPAKMARHPQIKRPK